MYTVNANLEATGSIPDQIKEVAKSKGIKIMPLITNEDFSQGLMANFLSSTTAQDSVIYYLVSEAQNEGYIGWQFDFEHMAATDSEPYSAFVEKAATALHQNNLILSVAVVARIDDITSTDGYRNWSGVYDYAQIAKYADFISIMTYDDPNSVGPTASIIYDANVLKYLYDKVPSDKISLGIPFFYYGWDETSPPGEIVRYAGVYSRLQYVKLNYEPQEYYSDILGSPYLTYQLDGHQYVSFFDNAKSTQMKLDLVNSRHLRGFSAWVLGMENPDVWNAINK
jgi:spore germination protein YaaH